MSSLEWLIVILHTLAAIAASWHALLYKRDSRAALGWISVCILFPLVGPLLYYLLGVNRVENKARLLGRRGSVGRRGVDCDRPSRRFVDFERGSGLVPAAGDPSTEQTGLMGATQAVTGLPLLEDNLIEILYNGEGAYPPMLEAITKANNHIYLSTYIFETNETGRQFIDALGKAVSRGVDVRVMIDGMGEKYSFPRAAGLLKQLGVQVCRFNPPTLVPPSASFNLRNHRKILVVDNRIGFTGGINIGDRHLVENPAIKKPVADIHFSIVGPVVDQLTSNFDDGWRQSTDESLPIIIKDVQSKDLFGGNNKGNSRCRVITDGPDENLDRLALVLEAAVNSAQRSISIMTPYFLPSRALIGCIRSAALRGVKVRIVLPEKSNLRYVHWATRNMLWELLYYNVDIFYQPPPFSHSKLFLVDDDYALLGSANIDPRSLRLNYELGLEVYDQLLSEQLYKHFDQIVDISRSVTLEEVDSRSLPERTRDALCWLFSPYL